MKHLVLASVLLATPALADKLPPALLMPTSGLQALRQYLAKRPYDEAQPFVDMLDQCSRAQVPTDGVLVDRGECPAVSQARQQEDEARAEKEKAKAKPAPTPTPPPAR